jgi:hypothetical protein
MATYFKKPSIEKAEQSVIMDRVLEQKKKELSPEEYNKYANYTTQQELLEEAARRNLLAIPDPKLHQQISFIKSGIRILGYFLLPVNLLLGAGVLILSEIVGIYEELV